MKPTENTLQQLLTLLAELTNQTANTASSIEMEILQLCWQLVAEGQHLQRPDWAAHMTSSLDNTAILGQVISGLHNGNLLSAELYPVLKQAEQELLQWFFTQFRFAHGHLCHASSYANLEALWQARECRQHASNIVYASKACHYSIYKACQLLGLQLITIDTDEQDRIDVSKLEQACQHQPPMAIIISVGTTACGAIDPVEKCIELGRHYHAWSHIDAAWGGALALLPEYEKLSASLSRANSACIDPHKSLAQPRPCSVLLYQQPLAKLDIDVDYLSGAPDARLPGSYGAELFLPLWLSIKNKGIGLFRQQIRERLQQAADFAAMLREQTDWQVYESSTGIVCFTPTKPLQLNNMQGILSQAKMNGQPVYRTVFASPATEARKLIKVLSPYF